MKPKKDKPGRVIPAEVFCIDEGPAYFTAEEEQRLADPRVSEAEKLAIINKPITLH